MVPGSIPGLPPFFFFCVFCFLSLSLFLSLCLSLSVLSANIHFNESLIPEPSLRSDRTGIRTILIVTLYGSVRLLRPGVSQNLCHQCKPVSWVHSPVRNDGDRVRTVPNQVLLHRKSIRCIASERRFSPSSTSCESLYTVGSMGLRGV